MSRIQAHLHCTALHSVRDGSEISGVLAIVSLGCNTVGAQCSGSLNTVLTTDMSSFSLQNGKKTVEN